MLIEHPVLRPLIVFAYACVITLAALGCDPNPEATPRNLILISVDTLRADHLGAYGSTRGLTPHLDALAGESVRFEHAYAPTPFTLGSVASLMTGLYPEEVGVEWNRSVLAPGIPTLASVLRAAGFETSAVVSNFVLRGAKSGIDAGFDHFDDTLPQHEVVRGFPERIGGDTTQAALAALATLAESSDRFFLWVHYQDPHGPYTPGEEARARYFDASRADAERNVRLRRSLSGRETGALPEYQYIEPHLEPEFYRAGYEAEVARMDAAVGELLEALRARGLLDDSLLVFVADHGESLGEHDFWFAHGEFLHDALVRVPLLLRDPRAAPATRSEIVSLVDVVPTVLNSLRVAAPARSSGRDVMAANGDDAGRAIYLTTLREASRPRFGIVTEGHKYLVTPRLPSDGRGAGPADERLHRVGAEHDALEASMPGEASQLRRRLLELRQAFVTPSTPTGAQDLSAEEQRQLEALGYVDEE